MKKLLAYINENFLWPVGLAGLLLLFLFLDSFFHWTFYGRNCQIAGGWWRLLGFVILGLGVWLITKLESEKAQIAVAFIALALALSAFAGFNFSIA